MYGYIRIYKPKLRFCEFDLYRGFYCGLCETLHQQYSTAARWTLSYDMTFLALLLTGLYEPKEEQHQSRCITHPVQKQLRICNDAVKYAADMSILLYREKCMDDWMDEKKLSRRVAAGLLQQNYQKVQAIYPEKAAVITAKLQDLHKMEQNSEENPELPAGCFGNLLAEIFAWKTDAWEQTLREIGFYLGKFIYLMDAYDDLKRDEKKECYNPFLALSKSDPNFDQDCEQMLQMMIAACAAQFEYLPIEKNVDILRNILYAGVWSRFRQIKQKTQKENEDGSI